MHAQEFLPHMRVRDREIDEGQGINRMLDENVYTILYMLE